MSELSNSSVEYNRRIAILESLCAGRTVPEIIKFFKYPRSTVYNVASRYKNSKKVEEFTKVAARKRHFREKTARTPEVVQKSLQFITENPEQSLKKLAGKVGVSEATMRRIAGEDLPIKRKKIETLEGE